MDFSPFFVDEEEKKMCILIFFWFKMVKIWVYEYLHQFLQSKKVA